MLPYMPVGEIWACLTDIERFLPNDGSQKRQISTAKRLCDSHLRATASCRLPERLSSGFASTVIGIPDVTD